MREKPCQLLEIDRENDQPERPVDFYSPSIQSMTVVVGKNGSGKTSLLDFLRNDFFRLLSQLDRAELEINKGVISEESTYEYLAVFRIADIDYFFTNRPDLHVPEGVHPYSSRVSHDPLEATKVIYFSNILEPRASQLYGGSSGVHLGQTEDKQHKTDGKKIRQVDRGVGFIDLSSNAMFHQENLQYVSLLGAQYRESTRYDTNNQLENSYVLFSNTDFIKQLAFVDYQRQTNFSVCGELSDLCIHAYDPNGESWNRGAVYDVLPSGADSLLTFLKSESMGKRDYTLRHFSSGEYARFVFLARLFWCLEGYERYGKQIGEINANLFNIADSVSRGSNAVLFIDEGEINYHPEWQREYIHTLLRCIDRYTEGKNIRLQIVITSNSPFLLSDLPAEDIVYLSDPTGGGSEYAGPNTGLTFGGNIHTMLRSNFFMDSTIGEFARQKLQHVINLLSGEKRLTSAERNEVEYVLSILQEPLLKTQLRKQYNERESNNIDRIDREIAKLQQEKERLKQNDTNPD